MGAMTADPKELERLGLAALDEGRVDDGIAHLAAAVEHPEAGAQAFFRLGIAYNRGGKPARAIETYERLIAREPGHADARNNLGNLLWACGRLTEAQAHFAAAIAIQPHGAELFNNLGNVLRAQFKLDEAAAHYGQALRLNPRYGEAFSNLGAVLRELGRPGEAEAVLRHALRLLPGYAMVHMNLGTALADQGLDQEALVEYERALAIEPNFRQPRMNQSIVQLLNGDFARGWSSYEARLDVAPPNAAYTVKPRWYGEALEGKTLLVHAEQGLGDTLQFVRYAQVLKERGARVLVQVHRPLVSLAARVPGVELAVPEGAPTPPHDLQIPMMSLPGVFKTTLTSVFAPGAYVFAEPDRVERWRAARPSGKFTDVGIVWRGNPGHTQDRARSVALDFFAGLARPGVRLHSVQVGRTEELATCQVPIVDLASRFDGTSFEDAAAAVASLDLVIAVDTAIVHLAGALGKPVWVALAHVPDWRWQKTGETTPWYPTMRLFRQARPYQWQPVFQRIAASLDAFHAHAQG